MCRAGTACTERHLEAPAEQPQASRTKPSKPTLELADILRAHRHELGPLTYEQQKAVSAIVSCGTAQLGGHAFACDRCGSEVITYNSCRNRHCPRCLTSKQREWLEAREAELLPVQYFHVVMTIPEVLRPIFQENPRETYSALFDGVAALKEVARDERLLGAEIGFTAVLHTWTQKLDFHPHIHCVVPGGGLAGDRWVACAQGFFLPVKVLSRVFRNRLTTILEALLERGVLAETTAGSVRARLDAARREEWVVYCKPPFAGPEQVLRYLSRYTHRVAISNHRLASHADGQVTFKYKDRSDGDRERRLTLDARTFLLRFLQHVLPSGFVRIRHYGLLAHAKKEANLALCREKLAAAGLTWQAERENEGEREDEPRERLCPVCREGRLVRVEEIAPQPPPHVPRGPPS